MVYSEQKFCKEHSDFFFNRHREVPYTDRLRPRSTITKLPKQMPTEPTHWSDETRQSVLVRAVWIGICSWIYSNFTWKILPILSVVRSFSFKVIRLLPLKNTKLSIVIDCQTVMVACALSSVLPGIWFPAWMFLLPSLEVERNIYHPKTLILLPGKLLHFFIYFFRRGTPLEFSWDNDGRFVARLISNWKGVVMQTRQPCFTATSGSGQIG